LYRIAELGVRHVVGAGEAAKHFVVGHLRGVRISEPVTGASS
jgi:hypothetical protein